MRPRRAALLAALLASSAGSGAAWAQDVPAAAQQPVAAYAAKGADTCLKCHDEGARVPVMDIFRTPHARAADARTPFAGRQCEACHGAGDTHARGADDDPVPPMRNFGWRKSTPVAEQNHTCLACHAGGHRTQWPGSAHERAELPCAGCHQIHAARDAALAAESQSALCFTCHRAQHAQSLKPSAHPLRQGALACADCHAVHGGPGDALLASPTVNETCYRCHAEKRGPFLWEHAPVAEDCGLCHQPHGTVQPALLVQRPPLLCQGCHAAAGHPSVAYGADGLASGTPSGFLLGQGCVNCHSQVHGSNHPSGATLTR